MNHALRIFAGKDHGALQDEVNAFLAELPQNSTVDVDTENNRDQLIVIVSYTS